MIKFVIGFSFLLSIYIIHGCKQSRNSTENILVLPNVDSVNFHNYNLYKLLNVSYNEDEVDTSNFFLLLTIKFPYADSSMVINIKRMRSHTLIYIYKFSPFSNYLFSDFKGEQINASLVVYNIESSKLDSIYFEANKLIKNSKNGRLSPLEYRLDPITTSVIISSNKKIFRHITTSLRNDIMQNLVRQILILGKQDPYITLIIGK